MTNDAKRNEIAIELIATQRRLLEISNKLSAEIHNINELTDELLKIEEEDEENECPFRTTRA